LRYAQVLAEIRKSLSTGRKWLGITALLDELHGLRSQCASADGRRHAGSPDASRILSETTRRLATGDAPTASHGMPVRPRADFGATVR
jgi:hypothetical protein